MSAIRSARSPLQDALPYRPARPGACHWSEIIAQRPDWLAGVGGFELPNDGMFPLFSHRIDNTSRADPQNHRSAMASRFARLRAASDSSSPEGSALAWPPHHRLPDEVVHEVPSDQL